MSSSLRPDWNAVVFPRREFLEVRFAYHAGEHLSMFGPTGDGKTTLAFQLLNEVASPELPVVNLVKKKRDQTVSRLSGRAGFQRVATWPPSKVKGLFSERPRGWTVWPKYNPKDIPHTKAVQRKELGNALVDSFARGNRIVFADELYGLTHELGLEDEVNEIYTQGRSDGVGLWSATQRPAYVPRNAYSQATHVFLSPDPDRDARKRYSEIGGFDPKLVMHNLERCGPYQWVYIRKRGAHGNAVMCIVDK